MCLINYEYVQAICEPQPEIIVIPRYCADPLGVYTVEDFLEN